MKLQTFGRVLLGLCLISLTVAANPTGGNVAAGSASIAGQGTGAVTIHQASNTAIINWQTFSIGAGESTTFLQPSAQSAVLNRVLGGQTSLIDGTLSANGQVYLINGNGIIVGPGGVISANAITASTRDISNADFLCGNLHFTGSGDGGVENFGSVSALGGDVVLIGKMVDNEGTISAAKGTAGLVAGDDVLLAQKNADGSTIRVSTTATASSAGGQVGVRNGGSITAAAAELKAANGNIYALAIQNAGLVRATTVKKQGGHIWLTADSGAVVNSGTLDASAAAAGGKGGAIETSGESVSLGGKITAGQGGTWLIDPSDVTIDNNAGSATDFNVTTLDDSLSSGTSVTITASGGTTDSGNIDVNAPAAWTGASALTLSAEQNINVNAGISSSGGGAVNLNADNTGTGVGTVNFNNGARVSTSGAVSIYYNPTNPGRTVAGTINGTEYTTPTSYSGDVTGGATLTAYMLVNNVYDLQNMENNLSGDYALGTNINASATASWNPTLVNGATVDEGFFPVGPGPYVNDGFSGDFDGQGHSVSSLYILNPNTGEFDNACTGLFGLATGGTIENVSLTNMQVTGYFNVGGLVGTSGDTVTNCSTSGKVSVYSGASGFSDTAFGGLEGENDGAVNFCSSSATVNTLTLGGYVGGLVGEEESGGSILNSHSSGATTGGDSVGGLVGLIGGTAPLTNCYATGAVTADVADAGGLVGSIDSSATVSSCYSTGPVVLTEGTEGGGLVGSNLGNLVNDYSTSTVGGGAPNTGGYIIGGLVGDNQGSISQCYSTGRMTGLTFGGLVGEQEGTCINCFWDTTTSGITSSAGGVGAGSSTGIIGATSVQLGSPSFIAANTSAGSWNFALGSGVWGINGFTNAGSGVATAINNGLPFFQWQYSTVSVTANNQSVAYSGALPTLSNASDYTISGNSSLLLSTPSLSVTGIGINAGGSDTIVVKAVPQVGDAVELFNGALTITKAPLTVTANSGTITYQGSAFSGGEGVTYSGFVDGQGASVLGGTLSYTGNAQGAENVGNYALMPAGLTSSNYNISFASGQLTINPAVLTVTANSLTESYNGQVFNGAGVTYVGLKGSDSASSVLNGTVGLTGNAIGAVNAGSYTIVPGGVTLASNNYTLSLANGTLTISPAQLTLTVKAGSSIYGQNLASADPVPGLTITGLVGGDTAASIGYTSVITGTAGGITSATDAGSYKITLGGALADNNYVLKTGSTSPVGKTTTWSVTPDVLTLSGLTGTSIYGQTPATPAVDYTLTSSNGVTDQPTLLALLSGTPTTTAYTFNISDTTNAGKVNTDQITSKLTLASGVNAKDYTLKTTTQGIWTVTPDVITIAGLTGGSSTYGMATGFDGATYFTVTDEDDNPDAASLVKNDKATLTATATSNVGSYAVTTTGVLNGGVAANYKIVLTPGKWAITPQAVNITIGGGQSVYGAKPVAPTLTAVGSVNGKAVALTSALLKGYSTDLLTEIGATGNSGAGQYSIGLTGSGTGNYVASDPGATATWMVTPAMISAITVSKAPKSIYGTSPLNTALTVTGLVNGDKASVLGYTLVGTGGDLTATTNASKTAYTFTVGGSLTDPNYFLKAGVSSPVNASGALTVNPATLTISALTGSSIFGTDPIYGNAVGDFGYSVAGLVNGDTIGSTDILNGFTETPTITSTTAAGKHTIVVKAPTVLSDTNYTVKVASGIWTVLP